MTPIATIKLAPGQVGYFDEYSRIHLTAGNPIAHIMPGTNCAQIRRSIKSGRLLLLSGTLGEDVKPFKLVKSGAGYKLMKNLEEEHAPVGIKVAKQEAAPVVEQAPVEEVEEVTAVEEEAAPVVEETEPEETTAKEAPAEEVEAVEEAPKKKGGRKKKTAEK